MPIKFRCVYCNQLLGISRRKAGNVVDCTNCHGRLIVPEPKEAVAPVGGSPGELPPANRLFEHSDFHQLLKPGKGAAEEPSPPRPTPVRSLLPTTKSVDDDKRGVTLTPAQLTLLTAGVVLAVGLAFTGGLVLGLAMRG